MLSRQPRSNEFAMRADQPMQTLNQSLLPSVTWAGYERTHSGRETGP